MAAGEQRPITVACCLWSDWPDGIWPGLDYVERLRKGVDRNLSVPHRFICFHDRAQIPWHFDRFGIEFRPLKSPVWLGCLPKLYVYSPEAGLSGRVILFDLDNVITGSLDDMAAYDGKIAVRGTFRDSAIPDGDMISFDADQCHFIWERFINDVDGAVDRTEGRERWFLRDTVGKCDHWQDIIPGQIVSYKRHCRQGLPKDARVVSMHGVPRPHQVIADWLTEHWRT